MLTVLVVFAGWFLLGVVVALALSPLLRRAAAADRRVLEAHRGASAAAAIPWLRRSSAGLDRLAGYAREVLGAQGVLAVVRELDRRAGATVVAQAGSGADLLGRRVATSEGCVALALRGGRPVVVPARSEAGLVQLGVGPRGQGWLAAVPVTERSARPAVLVAGWERKPTPVELELLDELAALVDATLAHDESQPADAKAAAETLDAVAELGRPDGEAGGHAPAVGRLAGAVARKLALDATSQLEVELAGLLHDVGKRRLPGYILDRAGALPEREWRVVHRHPEWGAQLVAAIPGLEAVALIVHLHHERPDGRGYPYGLTGNRIPLASRILAVCEAWCAMTTERSYRPALEPDEALQELERLRGTQFDARVVDAFTTVAQPETRPAVGPRSA